MNAFNTVETTCQQHNDVIKGPINSHSDICNSYDNVYGCGIQHILTGMIFSLQNYLIFIQCLMAKVK